MATEEVINVYGIPPLSPQDQLMQTRLLHQNNYEYMRALIKAESINPNRGEDYDGSYTAEWLKKIAVLDTDVNSRIKLIDYFENI